MERETQEAEAANGLSRRRTQTRERILDAAQGVIAERGVQAASVEEISERAGFTRGAFYSNFASKDELCAALLRRSIEQGLSAANAAVRGVVIELPGKSLDEAIELGVGAFLDLQPRGAEETLLRMELQLHAIRTPETRALYEKAYAGAEPEFATLVEQAVRSYGYRLVLPGVETIAVLHAVYDHVQANSLASGVELTRELLATPLIGLLRSLIVPEAST